MTISSNTIINTLRSLFFFAILPLKMPKSAVDFQSVFQLKTFEILTALLTLNLPPRFSLIPFSQDDIYTH